MTSDVQAAREPADPMERIIAKALRAGGFLYASGDGGGTASGLDFEVEEGPAIEVKRLHSPRIAEQMSRVEDVIAVQGEGAVLWFAALLERAATAERERDEARALAAERTLERDAAMGAETAAWIFGEVDPAWRLATMTDAMVQELRCVLLNDADDYGLRFKPCLAALLERHIKDRRAAALTSGAGHGG